jgi:hypothetical protein
MRKSAKPKGLHGMQPLIRSRKLAMAIIPAVFLLVNISLTPQAKTAPTRLKPAEAIKGTEAAKAGVKKGCLPEVGTEAYKRLMSPTSPTAPPAPVRRVAFDEEMISDGQWCWKQSCEHIEWVCSQGVAEDVNGCCVRCCWEWDPSNCSESRCCNPR